MDTTLTSAIIGVPRREARVRVHGCGDLEEQCQRAALVVIAEVERDAFRRGGHFRGAIFDHSLHVAPFCTFLGMMSMWPYRTAPFGGLRVWHLQLGVGGMKGHIIATDFRHTRLVRQTCQYKALLTLVYQIASESLPEWFTWTTMQLSCNGVTKPHQLLHDSSPWWAVFSTRRHTRGHIWAEAGCVFIGRCGRRCRMQCLDGVTRKGATYNLSQQGVVARTDAWHATCSWHG